MFVPEFFGVFLAYVIVGKQPPGWVNTVMDAQPLKVFPPAYHNIVQAWWNRNPAQLPDVLEEVRAMLVTLLTKEIPDDGTRKS
jgi:hypothetical protein